MQRSRKKIHVFGIPVSPQGGKNMADLFSGKTGGDSLLVTFVNPHACALAMQHADYVQVLEKMDVVACDGIGMVKAAHAYGLKTVERQSFDYTSLAGPVFNWAASNKLRVGLVGGKPGVTDSAAHLIRQKYPGINIVACFSGYGADVDDARRHFLQERVELVICGMGAPLQEKFLTRLKADGWQGVGFTCGGFLDQLITGDCYYPAWVDRLNIRFLYRLLKEPRRLWRRYLVDYQVFLGHYGRLQWQKVISKLGAGKSPDGTL